MNIDPIKTESDYHNTLQEIEDLMMAKTDSIEGERLDVLVTLVEDYERKHYPELIITVFKQNHIM